MSRVRVHGEYGTLEFMAAYRSAVEKRPDTVRKLPVIRDNSRHRQQIGKSLERALKGAKSRAKAKGVEFSLDYAWALQTVENQKLCCALSGIPFYGIKKGASTRHPYSPSLDRIDPAKGYTKENVRIILSGMNVMLLDWGTDVFETIARRYRLKTQKVRKTKP